MNSLININDIKNGMTIIYDGKLFLVPTPIGNLDDIAFPCSSVTNFSITFSSSSNISNSTPDIFILLSSSSTFSTST